MSQHVGYSSEKLTSFSVRSKGVQSTPQGIFDFSNLALVHQFRVNCMKAFDVLAEATKLMQRTQ